MHDLLFMSGSVSLMYVPSWLVVLSVLNSENLKEIVPPRTNDNYIVARKV